MKHVPTFYEFINEKNEPLLKTYDPYSEESIKMDHEWKRYLSTLSKEELIEMSNIIHDIMNSPEPDDTPNC